MLGDQIPLRIGMTGCEACMRLIDKEAIPTDHNSRGLLKSRDKKNPERNLAPDHFIAKYPLLPHHQHLRDIESFSLCDQEVGTGRQAA